MEDRASGIWLELSLDASVEAADAISELFLRHRIQRVAVENEIVAGEDGGAISSGKVRLSAFLPKEPDSDAKIALIERSLWHLTAFGLAPISALSKREIREEDWANSWKEHFYTFRVGHRIVIKPTWREYLASPGDVVIELDPGMAFGTGLHPTTQMMLEGLERWMRDQAIVLDVGTGSGILSIAAAKLGAVHVDAVDVEEVACRVARENAATNGVSNRIRVSSGSVAGVEGNYDLVVANITAAVLADLMNDLSARLSTTGVLLLSGIIEQNAFVVREALRSQGLRVTDEARSGDWLFLAAQK